MSSSQQQVEKAGKLHFLIEDDQSYEKCCKLLDDEFDDQQINFNKSRRNIKIGIQKCQEHIDLTKEQKIIKNKENKLLEEDIKQLEITLSKVIKRKNRKQALQQSIQEINKIVQENNKKLQQCKQKSLQQKTIFEDLQTTQSNLLAEISQVQSQEKSLLNAKKSQQKYAQLQKFKQKLLNKASSTDEDVELYLKEKISLMSSLRTTLLSVQQQLDDYAVKIQEQQFVISGLKTKIKIVQDNIDGEIYNKYKSKYEDLYFNGKNHVESWKNYKNYLEQLLKRNQVQYQPYEMHQNQQKLIKDSRKSKIKTQPSVFYIEDKKQEPDIKISRFRTPSKFQNRNRQRLISSKNPSRNASVLMDSGVKLPKLVRLRGKNQKMMKQTLKSSVKRILNESDISLESIESKGDNTSGQYIEVQYHKQ